MSQTVVDALEDQSVVASLQPGPRGTVRLSYEYPHADMASHFMEGFVPQAQMQQAYVSPTVVEIDRAKLLQLKFSQEELAEIGFSLVLRLSGLLRHSGDVSGV
jgi:hypothetical protein